MSTDQDKPVELEQVPLKSDTDAPAGTTETFDEAFPPLPSQKKTVIEEKTTITEHPKDEEKASEEKPKKKCWWGKHKTEEEQRDDHISMGVDLVNRDEKCINGMFAWGFRRHLRFTRLFVYRFCSLILGLPAAILFGILFAIVSVINVFACVPIAKLLSIPANWIAKTWSWLVHAIIDPLATSLALLFSSFTIRKYGINSQPTDPCVA
ncbi:Caveolin [Ostertagia ostertagi]